MAKRKGFWMELGSQVGQIVRSLATWVGMESNIDEVSKSLANYDIQSASDLQKAISDAFNKIAKQRDLRIDKINQKISEFYNLPKTRNMIRAIQQEKKKLDQERQDAYDEYAHKSGYAEKAQNLLNEYQSQNETAKAYDAANYQGNIREALAKIEQPAGSNIGPGKI